MSTLYHDMVRIYKQYAQIHTKYVSLYTIYAQLWSGQGENTLAKGVHSLYVFEHTRRICQCITILANTYNKCTQFD